LAMKPSSDIDACATTLPILVPLFRCANVDPSAKARS